MRENDFAAYRRHENEVHRAWCKRNPEKVKQYYVHFRPWYRAWHQDHRREALNHYANGRLACVCCGEEIYEFLTLDHVDGNGRKHRESLRGGGLYDGLKNAGYPSEPRLQILCYNCNEGREKWGGTCPHESGVFTIDEVTCDEKLSLRRRALALVTISNDNVECSCCKERAFQFLTIDHVASDGGPHRRKCKANGLSIVDWILKYPYDPNSTEPRLQVLCWNCNLGRRSTPNRICPHYLHAEDVTGVVDQDMHQPVGLVYSGALKGA